MTGVRGIGKFTREREDELKKLESKLDQVTADNKARREKVTARLDELQIEFDQKIKAYNATQEARNGFLEQLKALHQLADKNEPIRNATRFLIILLSLIETAPVLIKLLARRGPYDDLLEAIEHKTRIRKKKEISDFNSEINKELERYDSVIEARWLLEEQLRRSALNLDQIQDLASADLRTAQSDIAQAAVAAWRRKELRDIKGVMNENGLHRASGISLWGHSYEHTDSRNFNFRVAEDRRSIRSTKPSQVPQRFGRTARIRRGRVRETRTWRREVRQDR